MGPRRASISIHTQPRRLAGLASGGAALVVMMAPVACGNDISPAENTSTTASPTTVVVVTSVVTVPETAAAPTTTATSQTTTAATAPQGALDWDGVRYDFGKIAGLSSNENQDLITFDRYQLYDNNGDLQSAADFTEEPIVVGNSDVPWVNENPKERTYVLHPEAEVLTLANPGELECGGSAGDPPAWQSNTVEDLFTMGTPESTQVSLMFNDDGLVTLVRISESC
ncbi:MAG: hypothetical protein R2754_08690 [Microthrixaceae bacterium]